MNLLYTKILFFLFFLLNITIGNTQETARKFVLDEKSQTTIPFVNIKLQNGTKGWISDENGAFEVNIDKLNKSDLFIISAMGYQNLMISYNQFMDTSIITMLPKTFTLNEVEVKTRRYKQGYLGEKRRKTIKAFDYGIRKRDLSKPNIDAIFIPNTLGANGIIDNIHLFVYQGSKTPIKIQLYDNDELKGIPTTPLLDEPILIKEEESRKWLNVSIKNENISIPKNGFYISVDWQIDTIYIEKTDTVIKKVNYSDGKTGFDTIISNGMVLGETFSKSPNRWKKSDSIGWFNPYTYSYNKNGQFVIEKNHDIKQSSLYQTLAIYATILYDKADKHYQENVFDKNGIVPNKLTTKIIKKKYKKVKTNSALYPQNDILSLLESLKKSQVNNDVSYSLNYLYFYTYEELEDIINRDIDSTNISLPFLDELIKNIDKLILTEIEQGLYSFEYEKTIYGNLQLNNGVWKLSPTFNIIEIP